MESRRDRDRVFPIIHVKVLLACYASRFSKRSIEIFQLVLDPFRKGKSKVFAFFFFFFSHLDAGKRDRVS